MRWAVVSPVGEELTHSWSRLQCAMNHMFGLAILTAAVIRTESVLWASKYTGQTLKCFNHEFWWAFKETFLISNVLKQSDIYLVLSLSQTSYVWFMATFKGITFKLLYTAVVHRRGHYISLHSIFLLIHSLSLWLDVVWFCPTGALQRERVIAHS